MKGLGRALRSFSSGPDRGVGLRFYVERVTGIEPAWPAWKAGPSNRVWAGQWPIPASGRGLMTHM